MLTLARNDNIAESLSKINLKEAFINSKQKFYKSAIESGSSTLTDSDEQFLRGALEYIDPIVYKPLKSFFYYQDMPLMYGGGAIEYSSWYTAQYNCQTTNNNGISGSATVITKINATFEKHTTIVKSYAWASELSWIDEMKMSQVGSSIPALQDEGIMLYYNQKLDNLAFFGMIAEGDTGAYGLFNNSDITATTVDTEWVNATTPADEASAIQVFTDFNNVLIDIAEATAYDRNKMPNHIIFAPTIYTKLNQPMVLGSGNLPVAMSILEYIKKNNILNTLYTNSDEELLFFTNKYLENATYRSRGIITRYDRNVYCMPIAMDLTRGPTMYNPSTYAREVTYVAFLGQPQFKYPDAITYLDGLWAAS